MENEYTPRIIIANDNGRFRSVIAEDRETDNMFINNYINKKDSWVLGAYSLNENIDDVLTLGSYDGVPFEKAINEIKPIMNRLEERLKSGERK
ncbi:MAG: hypothetical protein ACOC1K_00275 [Nanoarchaeota archaeon]